MPETKQLTLLDILKEARLKYKGQTDVSAMYNLISELSCELWNGNILVSEKLKLTLQLKDIIYLKELELQQLLNSNRSN